MIVLTDTRKWSDTLLADMKQGSAGSPSRGKWRDLSSWELPPSEQPLWAALGPGSSLSRCELTPEPSLSDWDYLVIIDEASGSQFDVLRGLDPARLPGSVACVAATGKGFHGHHSRSWQTQPGNLHLSTLCNPDLDAARCGLAMTTLPAVAVMDALATGFTWASPPGIKWVNDILIDGKKVAGVLTATQSTRNRLTALTLGIGLNIETAPDVAATPFVPAVGCLADFPSSPQSPPDSNRGHLSVGCLLAGCLGAISTRLGEVRRNNPEALIQAYRDSNLVLGRRVVIWPDSPNSMGDSPLPSTPLAEGVVQAIGPDLALTLDSHAEPITRGRLALQDDPSSR